MMDKSKLSKGIRNPKKILGFTRGRVDNILGKILFRNEAGLTKNLNAINTIKTIKNTPQKNIESDNPHLVEFAKNGFTILGCPFDPSLIKSVAEKCSKLVEDERYSFMRSGYDGKIYSRMINQVFKLIPEIKNLLTDEIINMVKEYYQGNFQIKHVRMWRNYPIPAEIATKKEISSSHWHVDGEGPTTTTLFVYLTDVTDEDGPLHIQSRQRSSELVKMGFKSRFDYHHPNDVMEDPKHVVKHVGPLGSAIWANTEICLHRADNMDSGRYKDTFQFKFVPSDGPLKENWPQYCKTVPLEIAQDALRKRRKLAS